jgi:hypothetical protein
VSRVKPNQLLVIDVYTEWSGPCAAVESHLRRLRHSFVDAPDTLALARCRFYETVSAVVCGKKIRNRQVHKPIVVKIYNASSSLARFENKNIFISFETTV